MLNYESSCRMISIVHVLTIDNDRLLGICTYIVYRLSHLVDDPVITRFNSTVPYIVLYCALGIQLLQSDSDSDSNRTVDRLLLQSDSDADAE
jgi:hypothetical protein